ncbi:MAG TPA: ABC transporter substrate-binding protein [Candidatus Binatia bacterium]|jgi:ABC-type nitrate/sulfonate/bicarbonate transport system substrate-binding protein
MSDYQPIEIRGLFRSHTHLPIWEVIEQAGIWNQVGLKVSFEFCDSSTIAEAALFGGKVDFVSGNHITPYALVARGKSMVCLASPSNSVTDKLVSREAVASVADLRGKRIGDTTLVDSHGGYHHLRGNHMLYVMRGGLRLEEVQWVELCETMAEFRTAQLEGLKSGRADATFVTGSTEKYTQAGFHVLDLEPLPMITGPTLTSTIANLRRKERLGERLVKALVMGIHFARTRREETERILEGLKRREPQAGWVSYNSVAKLQSKPYPDLRGIVNAYTLCCHKDPKAKELSPLALWDIHDLRELDDSGFIDRLYQEGRKGN